MCIAPRLYVAPCFDAKRAARVNHCDKPHDAAVALLPTPREWGERHALARDFIDIAPDVFESADARRQDRIVTRLPFRKVLDDPPPRGLEIFLVDPREQSMRPSRAVRPNRRAERMIERLSIRAAHLDFAIDEPLAGFL